MKQFNPMQYMAIDIANHFGLDKLTYEERIQWVKDNINNLESQTKKAEEPQLYWKAVNAFRKAQKGEAIGHTIALDSVCSGLQIMSALMNCKSGAELTGLINPDKRSDAYTEITEYMNILLKRDGIKGVKVSRKDSKKAIMTSLYGSISEPMNLFGEDLLPYFYQAMEDKCNGAMILLELLRDSWNPHTIAHSWQLPDGYVAYVPVMKYVEKRIHIAELNYTPTLAMKINEPQGEDEMLTISNIANVVHSIDSYVLRSLVRRCNYHKGKLEHFMNEVQRHQTKNKDTESKYTILNEIFQVSNEHHWITLKYQHTNMVDIAWIDEIMETGINKFPNELIDKLAQKVKMVLSHKPFEVVVIHDSFSCHPNNCNQMRFHYKEIIAELAESTLIDDILEQLYGEKIELPKGESIAHYIRNSNYGIC